MNVMYINAIALLAVIASGSYIGIVCVASLFLISYCIKNRISINVIIVCNLYSLNQMLGAACSHPKFLLTSLLTDIT